MLKSTINDTTCPANACAAVNDNWRTTSVAVSLLRVVVDFQQSLLLLPPYEKHEVEEGGGRMWHSIVGPASKLQVRYFTRLPCLYTLYDNHKLHVPLGLCS